MNIDLHIHSTASDGTLSPTQILDLARKLNLGAIAITDHDTIRGAIDAMAQGPPPAVELMSGVEISAAPPPVFPRIRSLHILGYAICLDDAELNRMLAELQSARNRRAPRIIEKLNLLGIGLTVDDVLNEVSPNGLTGRPHVARALVRKGFARSIDDAFDRLLSYGKPAFVNKYRVPCERAIRTISGAGGVPVLAHPGLLPLTPRDVERLLVELIDLGLKGVEVFYPEHSIKTTRQLARLAARHGLLMTGGTDFHGANKPDIQMGCGRGGLNVPYDLYHRLVEAAPGSPLCGRPRIASGRPVGKGLHSAQF